MYRALKYQSRLDEIVGNPSQRFLASLRALGAKRVYLTLSLNLTFTYSFATSFFNKALYVSTLNVNCIFF